jgi:DNA invertase Pin-like site-specific DNA recombinase
MTSRVSARGYTVSAIAQTPDEQNAALAAAGVTKVFSDTMSGARDDRWGLAALLDDVQMATLSRYWTSTALAAIVTSR